ncbi:MAG: O-antigen ligase family protein, partial [Kineosporiaceae bacterium]
GTLRARALPAWPFLSLFVLYPLWWCLGITVILLPALGGICLFLMAMRGWIRLPRIWMWWAAYLIWMAASVVMVDSGGRLVGFAQRLSGALGATLLVVYVFNARESLPRRRVLAAMTTFLGWMVIGGYLGMLFPGFRLSTPAIVLAPPEIATNEYVVNLLSPRFAEVQHPYGATSDFIRPSAPFPYTNAWGHAFVLLLPVVAALAVRASRRTRWLLAALVASAVPPALATLNRGIAVGIAVALAYLALRYVRRASLVRVLQILGGSALVAGVVLASGVLNRVGERTSTSSTTEDRAALYREAFHRTLESPFLGWGAPRPSLTLEVSVGTQGHFWYLMFSHGFVGLALFLASIWGLALVTRRVRDPESILMHTVVVVIGVMLMFYGVDGIHLVIALTCGVLLMRPEPWNAPVRVREGAPR